MVAFLGFEASTHSTSTATCFGSRTWADSIEMGEVVMATPAVTGAILIIRGLEPSVRNCGIESANSGPLPTLLPEE